MCGKRVKHKSSDEAGVGTQETESQYTVQQDIFKRNRQIETDPQVLRHEGIFRKDEVKKKRQHLLGLEHLTAGEARLGARGIFEKNIPKMDQMEQIFKITNYFLKKNNCIGSQSDAV
ncbi:hypothetical protein NPIL_77161 [Nephila pilipes]|uniref:Uncharacterized protein n=1 Tax=Nephila pilipes TaxID=299642 RepID=A0A8X6N532_NEPPI|nr:hypothetical protein NPIL_77161 [Nephila pilipes]